MDEPKRVLFPQRNSFSRSGYQTYIYNVIEFYKNRKKVGKFFRNGIPKLIIV